MDLGAGRGFGFAGVFALAFCVVADSLPTVGDRTALGVPFAVALFAGVVNMAFVDVGVRLPAERVVDLADFVDLVDFLEFCRTKEAAGPIDVKDAMGGCCCNIASIRANGGVLVDRDGGCP